MKSQPTVKQFLSFNAQKRKTDPSNSKPRKVEKSNVPSTSNSETTSKRDRSNTASLPHPKKERTSLDSIPSSIPSSRAVDSQEIINIIDIMDGKLLKEREQVDDEVSLLSEVDKIKAPASTTMDCSDDKIKESTEIVMEIDDDGEFSQPTSFIESKKKKITDYFSKMTNHVNNYL